MPSSTRYPHVPDTLSPTLVSCYFDIRDTNKVWTPAVVQRVDMDNQRILVHYVDWPSRWDEYIPFPSPRIARWLSKRPDDAYGRPRQRNIATITQMKYGYHRHQAITALDKVGDVDANGQRNFMAALQWLQNNVDVPSDEEDEVYMDDYVLPSDVEYETEEEEEEEEEEEQEDDIEPIIVKHTTTHESIQHSHIQSSSQDFISFQQQQQPFMILDDTMNKQVSDVIRNALAALTITSTTPPTTITLSAIIPSTELTPTTPISPSMESMEHDTMSITTPLLSMLQSVQ